MNDKQKYKVLSSYDEEILAGEVTKLLNCGYILAGNLVATHMGGNRICFSQAMLKSKVYK